MCSDPTSQHRTPEEPVCRWNPRVNRRAPGTRKTLSFASVGTEMKCCRRPHLNSFQQWQCGTLHYVPQR